jgi:hypothetical protein
VPSLCMTTREVRCAAAPAPSKLKLRHKAWVDRGSYGDNEQDQDTKKTRELTEDRPLAVDELDAVSGGFFARYVMPTAKARSQIEDPRSFGEWITER